MTGAPLGVLMDTRLGRLKVSGTGGLDGRADSWDNWDGSRVIRYRRHTDRGSSDGVRPRSGKRGNVTRGEWRNSTVKIASAHDQRCWGDVSLHRASKKEGILHSSRGERLGKRSRGRSALRRRSRGFPDTRGDRLGSIVLRALLGRNRFRLDRTGDRGRLGVGSVIDFRLASGFGLFVIFGFWLLGFSRWFFLRLLDFFRLSTPSAILRLHLGFLNRRRCGRNRRLDLLRFTTPSAIIFLGLGLLFSDSGRSGVRTGTNLDLLCFAAPSTVVIIGRCRLLDGSSGCRSRTVLFGLTSPSAIIPF